MSVPVSAATAAATSTGDATSQTAVVSDFQKGLSRSPPEIRCVWCALVWAPAPIGCSVGAFASPVGRTTVTLPSSGQGSLSLNIAILHIWPFRCRFCWEMPLFCLYVHGPLSLWWLLLGPCPRGRRRRHRRILGEQRRIIEESSTPSRDPAGEAAA